MLEFAKTLQEELLMELGSTGGEKTLKAFTQEQRLASILDAIDQLKERMGMEGFRNEAEEICFFKTVMPAFLYLSIYNTEKYELDAIRLTANAELRQEGFRRYLYRIQDFAKQQTAFIRYYHSGRTDLDRQYFLRSGAGTTENRDLQTLLMDRSCCTTGCIKAATLRAYGQLERDIHFFLTGEVDEPVIPAARLQWTGSKSGLVEVCYAFRVLGVFNNGLADLKTIIDYLQQAFGVSLGNFYRTFQDNLYRKSGCTVFLESMRDSVQRHVDEIESRHIR